MEPEGLSHKWTYFFLSLCVLFLCECRNKTPIIINGTFYVVIHRITSRHSKWSQYHLIRDLGVTVSYWYRISANSFHRNYSREESIQRQKLFAEIRYFETTEKIHLTQVFEVEQWPNDHWVFMQEYFYVSGRKKYSWCLKQYCTLELAHHYTHSSVLVASGWVSRKSWNTLNFL